MDIVEIHGTPVSSKSQKPPQCQRGANGRRGGLSRSRGSRTATVASSPPVLKRRWCDLTSPTDAELLTSSPASDPGQKRVKATREQLTPSPTSSTSSYTGSQLMSAVKSSMVMVWSSSRQKELPTDAWQIGGNDPDLVKQRADKAANTQRKLRLSSSLSLRRLVLCASFSQKIYSPDFKTGSILSRKHSICSSLSLRRQMISQTHNSPSKHQKHESSVSLLLTTSIQKPCIFNSRFLTMTMLSNKERISNKTRYRNKFIPIGKIFFQLYAQLLLYVQLTLYVQSLLYVPFCCKYSRKCKYSKLCVQ